MILRDQVLGIGDLNAYRAVGEKFFPDTDWNHGLVRLRSMLEKWRDGIFCVLERDEIVGYMTLWPLLAPVVPKLRDGSIRDQDIDGTHLASPSAGPQPDWLMSAVAVVPKDRERRREIIGRLLAHFHGVAEANRPCSIYAHAVTEDGARFCRRTGFQFLFPAVKELCVYASPA